MPLDNAPPESPSSPSTSGSSGIGESHRARSEGKSRQRPERPFTKRPHNRRLASAAWPDFAIAGLAVLAPVLGGSLTQWAQATVLLLAAGIVLVAPPRRWPPWCAIAIAGILGLLAVLAFLPAEWFSSPRWRTALIADPTFTLASTLTPQPWRTLQSALLLGVGLVWLGYLLTRDRRVSRELLLMVYAGGMGVLALVCLVFYANSYLPPFWDSPHGFGPFRNRNQTANVFALSALVQLALAFHAFQRRSWAGSVWVTACVVSGVATVIPGSRGGILLFFASALVWIVWVTWCTKRMKHAGLGIAALLAGLTAFMMFGGATWERIHRVLNPHIEAETEGRVFIQADALRLWKDAGWRGVGPGNFAATFAQYRNESFTEGHAIHPESDWLWLGIEFGWFAPFLVMGGLGWWLWRHRPRRDEQSFHLRTAVVVAVVGFAVHSLVDVAGHRMGSVWPAIFLLSLVARRGSGTASTEARSGGTGTATGSAGAGDAAGGRAPALAFRVLAVLGVAIGGWWLLAAKGISLPPTTARSGRLKAEIGRLREGEEHRSVAVLCTTALEIAPLDPALYFYRGLARAEIEPGFDGAMLDFQRARHLQPNNAGICLLEGIAWLGRRPGLALQAWEEALARTRRQRHGAARSEQGLYRRMLTQARGLSPLRPGLRTLAGNDREMLLAFLESAEAAEFGVEVERLLGEDENLQFLDRSQRLKLFRLWAKNGDLPLLEEQVRSHPGWIETAWVGMAKAKAAKGAFEEACALAARYAEPPALPSVREEKDLRGLQRRAMTATNDSYAAYALYSALLATADRDGALVTVRRMTAQRGGPAYWHHIEAQLQSARGAWQEAWRAWERFLDAPQPARGKNEK